MEYFRQHQFGFEEPWDMSLCKDFPTAPRKRSVETVVKRKFLKKMKKHVAVAARDLYRVELLRAELHILKWFLYRYLRAFRHDKVFSILSKMKQGLEKFLTHHVNTGMAELNELLPSKIPPKASTLELPTKQLVKWVLFRLLGSSKILLRVIQLNTEAGRFIFEKVAVGWSSAYATVATSVNSRVLACVKWLLMAIVNAYDNVRVFLPMFTDTEDFFADWEFPVKICEFIGYVDVLPTPFSANPEHLLEAIKQLGKHSKQKKRGSGGFDNEVSGCDNERIRCKCFESLRHVEGIDEDMLKYEPNCDYNDTSVDEDDNNDTDDDENENDNDADGDDGKNDGRNDKTVDKNDNKNDDKNGNKNDDKNDDANDNNDNNRRAQKRKRDGKEDEDEDDDDEDDDGDDSEDSDEEKVEEEEDEEDDESDESGNSGKWILERKKRKILQMLDGGEDGDETDVFTEDDSDSDDDDDDDNNVAAGGDGNKKGGDEDVEKARKEDVKNEGNGENKDGGSEDENDEVIISYEKIVTRKN